ncbi:hypothetical protein A7K94_0215575 [Modestobacter sp. VKM Ac-2676]|nr:hypothetical protein A7K94_0215575 [Modestobacter sp. VKM Ac-2676]
MAIAFGGAFAQRVGAADVHVPRAAHGGQQRRGHRFRAGDHHRLAGVQSCAQHRPDHGGDVVARTDHVADVPVSRRFRGR